MRAPCVSEREVQESAWCLVAQPEVCIPVQLKHELTKEQEGPKYDVFVRVLRGLSNSKLAKPGKFRTADGLGYALRCSYKVHC